MPPGSLRGVQLVVADADAARTQLIERGVAAGTISVLDDRDGGTMFEFADPDGNAWVVQQIKARAGKPLLAH
jgi:predicted lactoylglutathione lyase